MLNSGLVWIGLLSLLIVSTLLAVTARGVDCGDATTQLEIEKCSKAEFENLNRALETAYSDYWKSRTGRERDLLERAQKFWMRYRDANCEASAAVYAGGSLAATEFVACKKRLSEERLAEMKRIYGEPPFPDRQ